MPFLKYYRNNRERKSREGARLTSNYIPNSNSASTKKNPENVGAHNLANLGLNSGNNRPPSGYISTPYTNNYASNYKANLGKKKTTIKQ
jgi:hypothetical protein